MRTLLLKLSLPLALSLSLGACGASGPRLYSSDVAYRDTGVELTPTERERLDDALVTRFEAREQRFPVRVFFSTFPTEDELLEMDLVRYDRAALGRVDRQMLKRIAGRADVSHIAFLAVAQYGS